MSHIRFLVLLVGWGAIVLGVFSELHSQEKSLHYGTVSVEARLDSAGVLHVSERQEMVFNGDWNGGERTFRVEFNQDLVLKGISRLVAGQLRPLREGDLTAVDTYKWVDSTTVRWRSRLPEDPPFDNTVITYVLDYTLSNILEQRGNGYLLNHDFAFPDRPGRIDSFLATLTLDPPWRAEQPIKPMRAGPLEPGRSYVLTLPLTYAAEGVPAGVLVGASPLYRYGLLVVFVASLVLLIVLFYRRESSVGRFAPLTPLSEIDDVWLHEHIFRNLPEVVGAAWDGKTGPAEVAAVLARMEAEKKIRTEVKAPKPRSGSEPVLHLTLLADRETLEGYEKRLVNALFFKGDTTDTRSVAAHYRSRGFDPAQKIAGDVEQQVKHLASDAGAPQPPSLKVSCYLAALAGVLLAGAWILRPHEILISIGPIVGISILYAIAKVLALSWRERIVGLTGPSLGFGIPLVVIAALTAWNIFTGDSEASGLLLAGSAALCLAIVNSVLNAAKTRQGPERILLRKRLTSGREYFRQELNKPNPRLQDHWLPYLVAFGLGSNVDQWFREYRASTAGHDELGRDKVAQSVSSSSASSGSGWTGGGGMSGGAGAGRSWAAAVGAMAVGVSSASSGSGSSSSSSGGSSSSSSSGGGGGGGW